MSWFDITVPFAMGLLYLFVPGFLIAVALRVRGFDAFALAPVLSIGAVMVGAIIAPVVGVTWGALVPFVAAVAIALLLGGLGLVVDKLGMWDLPAQRKYQEVAGRVATSSLLQRVSWYSKEQGLCWLSFLVGSVLLMRNVTNALGNPEWISQTWDNNFHLNAVRYITEMGNASPLTLNAMNTVEGQSAFYPGAWHAVVSLIFMGSGADIPVSTNTMALLVSSVVWPLGMVFMVRQLLKLNAPGIIVIGALSASFTAYPVLLLDFGVLYPNLLGISLIPPVVALIAQVFRTVKVRYVSTMQGILIGIPAGFALALAHPNALMSTLVIVIPIFITRLFIQWLTATRRVTTWSNVALTSLMVITLLGVIHQLWLVVRPAEEAGAMWGPVLSAPQAIGEAIVQGSMGQEAQWLLLALFLVGLYAMTRSHDAPRWIFFSWVVVTYFYVAARSLPWEADRYFVVGVWYHDSFRLAALLPLMAIPLMALAVDWLAKKMQNIQELSDIFHLSPQRAGVVGSIIALSLVGVLGQTSKPLEDQIEESYFSYQPTDESPLLTLDEINVLDTLDTYVPDGAEIVVQAFTGAPLAYALADRKVTAYHSIYTPDEETEYIQKNLNNAINDSRVCQIINDNKIEYYLDFGNQEVNWGDHSSWYTGYENLVESGILEEVYRSGEAVLYKIIVCS